MAGKPYTLVNVYVPPPFTKTWFEHIMGTVLEVAEGPLLFAGDFNTVLNSSLDRFGSSTQSPTPLCSYLKKFDLVDAWRWKYAEQGEYSCHSETHKTLSRIDLCLLSSELLSCVLDVKYLPKIVSDTLP